MGFNNLLNLSITNIDPSFANWIASRFDPVTSMLKIRENLSVCIDGEMVGWVLGVPGGNYFFDVSKASRQDYKDWKLHYMEETVNGSIDESRLFDKVCSEKSNKTMFKQHFLLYTLGVLLCPIRKSGLISSVHIYVLDKARKAYDYNWGKYVIEWLIKDLSKIHKKIEGRMFCTLLLAVSIYTTHYCMLHVRTVDNVHLYVYSSYT
ncbi:MAG TPA: hypothetical protein DHV20_02985 [Brochothrix thermosphacta]|nr:hypothetical protein [Brochothrix thermosphacta]